MQVKEIDINTGKIKGYGICKKKKVQNLIFRWSYHSDLLWWFILDLFCLAISSLKWPVGTYCNSIQSPLLKTPRTDDCQILVIFLCGFMKKGGSPFHYWTLYNLILLVHTLGELVSQPNTLSVIYNLLTKLVISLQVQISKISCCPEVLKYRLLYQLYVS